MSVPAPRSLEFLAALLDAADVETFLRFGEVRHLFREHETPWLDFVSQHVVANGCLPHPATFEEQTGRELPETLEPASYYHEHLVKRYVADAVRDGFTAAKDLIQSDPHAAYELLMDRLLAVEVAQHRAQIHDFREAQAPLLSAYARQMATGGVSGIRLGWPHLDAQMGGMSPGDLLAVCARPGQGKTWLLVQAAHTIWRTGRPVLFMSMEMDALLIQQRLAAIETGVPAMDLKLGQLTSAKVAQLKKRLQALQEAQEGLYVIDGALATTVPEIATLCRQLRPAAVIVDGAYLLKQEDKRMGLWDRIAAGCTQLKSLAVDQGLPVLGSWQLRRDRDKKKKDEPPTLDDVYGSDAIAQNASVILGLFEDDTPETARQRAVDILKGRGGERGRFSIGWDFRRMDFQEIEKPEPGAEPGELEHVG